ncbi:MAG: hypothetical protein ACRDKI_00225 [Solirubrobacterales bacterium]
MAGVVVAVAVAAPVANATDPLEAVRAGLVTTDPTIESGRFTATMSERGLRNKRRVISVNQMTGIFNLGNHRRFSSDYSISVSAAKFFIRLVALKRVYYVRASGTNYRMPINADSWYRMFHAKHAADPLALVDKIVAPLSDWRDDGPSTTSDGVAIELYSAAVPFSSLAQTVLPNMSKVVYDGAYHLYVSDPTGWADATPAGEQLPRITFGIDAENVMRTVHVEAPSALTTQGYELIGDFEFTDVNELVSVKRLPHAHKVTRKNVGKLLNALYLLDVL